jgi:TrpR family trp operon transcriptional repressor
MAKKEIQEGWQEFLKLCVKVKKTEELEGLFWLFLTPEERDDLATRYLIIKELLRGEKTQREMAKDLGVSIAKITRGSNFLKMIPDELRKLLAE